MTQAEKDKAKAFIKQCQQKGYMMMIRSNGEASTSPTLPAEDYAVLAEINKNVVAVIRSGEEV